MDGKRPHAVYCCRSCKSKACHDRLRRDNPAERDRNRARYVNEREKRIAGAVAYNRRHPEVAQITKRNRRAKMQDSDARSVTPKDWRRLCERFDHRCAYCGDRKPLSVEHVVPLVRGGRHAIGNILPACVSCNCSKRHRFLIEWQRDLRRTQAA